MNTKNHFSTKLVKIATLILTLSLVIVGMPKIKVAAKINPLVSLTESSSGTVANNGTNHGKVAPENRSYTNRNWRIEVIAGSSVVSKSVVEYNRKITSSEAIANWYSANGLSSSTSLSDISPDKVKYKSVTTMCQVNSVDITFYLDFDEAQGGWATWGRRVTHKATSSAEAISLWNSGTTVHNGEHWFSANSITITYEALVEEEKNRPVAVITDTPSVVVPTSTPTPSPTPIPVLSYRGNGASSGRTYSSSGGVVTVSENGYINEGYHFARYWTDNADGKDISETLEDLHKWDLVR